LNQNLKGSFNKLSDLVTIDRKVATVEPSKFWSAWNSIETVMDDPLGCDVDELDNRPHSSAQSSLIEAADVTVITNADSADTKLLAKTKSMVSFINPKCNICTVDARTCDATSILAPSTTTESSDDGSSMPSASPFVSLKYESRTPFSPERFFNFCNSYYFLTAFQYEEMEGLGNYYEDGDDEDGDDQDNQDSQDGDWETDDETDEGAVTIESTNEDVKKSVTTAQDANDDGDDDEDSDDDVMIERMQAKQEMDKVWHTKHSNDGGRILQMKGLAWIAGYHGLRMELKQSGSFMGLEMGKPYFAALEPKHWAELYPVDQHPALIAERKQHPFGDRKVHLDIVVKSEFEQAALIAELDECLLTKEEMEAGPESWVNLKDPFHMIGPENKSLHINPNAQQLDDQDQDPDAEADRVGSDYSDSEDEADSLKPPSFSSKTISTETKSIPDTTTTTITTSTLIPIEGQRPDTSVEEPEQQTEEEEEEEEVVDPDGWETVKPKKKQKKNATTPATADTTTNVTSTPSSSDAPDEAEQEKRDEEMRAILKNLSPRDLFEKAIYAALLKWDTLQYALNEGISADGDDIAAWMPGIIADLFGGKKTMEQEDIEDYVMDIMQQEFEMSFEEIPTSLRHLGKQVLAFEKDSAAGGNTELFNFVIKVAKATHKFDDIFPPMLIPIEGQRPDTSVEEPEQQTEEEEEEEEEEVVDPDGWETVKPKKKKK